MGNDRYQILIISASAEAEDMKLHLAESDFTAVSVINYHDALNIIRNDLPDLILLTKQIGVSSLSLINKINRQFPMVPIIMVATDITAENMREHLEAGASDYIYFVGAERELLPFVVEQNLEHRLKIATVEAQEEAVSLFEQLERDQQSGFRVQQAMLPRSPLSIRGLTFTHQLYPSMIMSGDFIDYFELPDGRLLFYIADVSGHGASSAFITVLLKSLSHRLLEDSNELVSTGDILEWFNSELLQWKLEQHVTMFLAIIDEKNNHLEYSNAAHFPGTILCHEKGVSFLEIGGRPLGLFDRPSYETYALSLPQEYCFVMFSDGVFEILPQKSLEDKEAHLLSVVKLHQQDDLDALIDDLGVLTASRIPDDIAVFTVATER